MGMPRADAKAIFWRSFENVLVACASVPLELAQDASVDDATITVVTVVVVLIVTVI